MLEVMTGTRERCEQEAAKMLADCPELVLALRVRDDGVFVLVDETPAEVFA